MSGNRVGLVVIGRNEGDRLVRCLASLREAQGRLVYVDSGSTDGSIAAAEAAGALVVTLPSDTPFTAALARNAGVAALRREGAPDFVQFVDGDCEVVQGWLGAAMAALEADPGLAVVCGRRCERFPEASAYNRLCDMEWNTPVGLADACGGDSMMRLEAFDAVGGFDPTLIAGEEPDLCLRLRRAGWRVRRLDHEMTLHDAAIHRASQWWRRTVRGGWAFAEGWARHGAGPERYNRRSLMRIVLWGAAVPAVAAVALLAGLAGAPTLWIAAAVAALYPLMALKTARGRRHTFGDPWRHALLYGALVMAGKPAEAQGALRYLRRRLAGGQARLIEYKGQ